MRSIHSTPVAIFILALAGCGGGGGEGGDGGGGSNVAADFALSTSAMSFTGVQNGPAPPAQTVTVSTTGGTFGTNGTVYLSSSVSGNAVDRSVALSAPIAPPGTGAQMLITPDGGSLIIAGKDGLVVMTTP